MKATAFLAAAILPGLSAPVLAGFESPASAPVPGKASASRPWDLTVRASLGNNDNVNLVPDATTHPAGTGTSADYFALQAEGSYRFYQSGNVTAGAALSVSSLWYESKLESPATWNISDYSFYALNPAVYLTYKLNVAGMPASVTGTYDYYREDGHNDNLHALGTTSHNVRVSGTLFPKSDLQVTASVRRGWDDFEVVFPNPALDSRDADRIAVDLGMRTWFANGLHNLSLGVGYMENDAKGSNFDYDGYNLRARFESGFLKPVWLAVELKTGDRDYGGFNAAFIPAPGRTSQDVTTAEFQVLWPIDTHWRVDGFYRHENYASNQPQFEADVDVLGAGVTYRF